MNEKTTIAWRHRPGIYWHELNERDFVTVVQSLDKTWNDDLCRYVISRKWFASVKRWGEEFPINIGCYDTASEGRAAVEKWLDEHREDVPE